MTEQIHAGVIVKHKKDKSLRHGTVGEISRSGIRARVRWEAKDNPDLIWSISAYYRLDLLEIKPLEVQV